MSTEDERYRRYFHDAEFHYRAKIVSEILKCDKAVDGFYADDIAIKVVDALFPLTPHLEAILRYRRAYEEVFTKVAEASRNPELWEDPA